MSSTTWTFFKCHHHWIRCTYTRQFMPLSTSTGDGYDDWDGHGSLCPQNHDLCGASPSLCALTLTISAATREGPVFCVFVNCTAAPFETIRDLDRHYKPRHKLRSQSTHCDYPDCTRGFTQAKTLREHLRRVHNETIRKGEPTGIERFPGDRRCYSCLERFSKDIYGEECPNCEER